MGSDWFLQKVTLPNRVNGAWRQDDKEKRREKAVVAYDVEINLQFSLQKQRKSSKILWQVDPNLELDSKPVPSSSKNERCLSAWHSDNVELYLHALLTPFMPCCSLLCIIFLLNESRSTTRATIWVQPSNSLMLSLIPGRSKSDTGQCPLVRPVWQIACSGLNFKMQNILTHSDKNPLSFTQS